MFNAVTGGIVPKVVPAAAKSPGDGFRSEPIGRPLEGEAAHAVPIARLARVEC